MCIHHVESDTTDEFVPRILLTNTMSLAPKIDELRYFDMDKKPDLAAYTETWLNDSISSECLLISGYNLICKNRTLGSHGGVCLYITNSILFKTLDHLHHPDIEVLWVHTWCSWCCQARYTIRLVLTIVRYSIT